VDSEVDVLYGPNPVQKTGTVTVPRELLREIGVESGDRVHWALNSDIPGTLVLIPSRLVARAMDDTLAAIRKKAK
jgi:antitoxin component of MazEF toxin-antitoxin module